MYHDMDDLIDVCISHMANEQFPPEQVRAHMRELLPKLDYWKRYTNLAGAETFDAFKRQLMDEINALQIEGMPKVEKLNALVDKYDFITARRGKGLMQGLVLEGKPVGEVVTKAIENGLIVISAGGNVLRMVPPLVITESDIDEMIEKLEKSF